MGKLLAIREAPGGASANVCGAFAKLGGETQLITKIGQNTLGDQTITKRQEGEIRREWFTDCFGFHCCSVSPVDFPSKAARRQACAYTKDARGIISFHPNLGQFLWPWEEQMRQAVWEFLSMCDILKVSQEELWFLTGERETEKAVSLLQEEQVKLILCTKGSEGAEAFWKEQGRPRHVYAASRIVSVKDTSGAGDGFIGSFLWQLSEKDIVREDLTELTEEEMRQFLKFSVDFCGECVKREGTIASYPNRAWASVRKRNIK